MQYLVLTSLDAVASSEIVNVGLEAEYQRVRQLYSVDVLRQIWRREDRRGAVLIFEAATEAEVASYLESLPLAKVGAVKVDNLIPLGAHAALLTNSN